MKSKPKLTLSKYNKQLILLVGVILLFRIIFVDISRVIYNEYGFKLFDFIVAFLDSSPAIIISVALDIMLVVGLRKYLLKKLSPAKKLIVMLLFVAVISVVGVAIVNYQVVGQMADSKQAMWQIITSFMAILLFNASLAIVADLILYFRQQHIDLAIESDKKHKAQYQYQQLKQQLNPHFLFNCLNNLDYLVQNGDQQRASDFVKKLAGVYRYLLHQAEARTVTVEEELKFVGLYTDLLKERFTNGLNVEYNIDDKYMERMIVPCGLQVLIENATKHNIVNNEKQLNIKIYTKEDAIVVSNNLQPRIGHDHLSTGVGLQNITRQYKDIANQGITIIQRDNEFVVELPLL